MGSPWAYTMGFHGFAMVSPWCVNVVSMGFTMEFTRCPNGVSHGVSHVVPMGYMGFP